MKYKILSHHRLFIEEVKSRHHYRTCSRHNSHLGMSLAMDSVSAVARDIVLEHMVSKSSSCRLDRDGDSSCDRNTYSSLNYHRGRKRYPQVKHMTASIQSMSKCHCIRHYREVNSKDENDPGPILFASNLGTKRRKEFDDQSWLAFLQEAAC